MNLSALRRHLSWPRGVMKTGAVLTARRSHFCKLKRLRKSSLIRTAAVNSLMTRKGPGINLCLSRRTQLFRICHLQAIQIITIFPLKSSAKGGSLWWERTRLLDLRCLRAVLPPIKKVELLPLKRLIANRTPTLSDAWVDEWWAAAALLGLTAFNSWMHSTKWAYLPLHKATFKMRSRDKARATLIRENLLLETRILKV